MTSAPSQVLQHLARTGCAARVSGCGISWDAAQLLRQVEVWSAWCENSKARRVATLVDNHPHWLALDLALRQRGEIHVPLPPFFTQAQLLHALEAAGIDTLVTTQPQPFLALGWRLLGNHGPNWTLLQRQPQTVPEVPVGTAVITFTSGSTGAPKGVCLSSAHLDQVAGSLASAMASTGARRHRCVLPLGVLLEHIAGTAAPLLLDAEVVIEPLLSAGLRGASGVDGAQLARALQRSGAHSVILLPQMLRALVETPRADPAELAALRLIAVGGARVGTFLLEQAAAQHLPVYEGYGLSECGSVIALNRPNARRDGSVGQPLSHVRVHIAMDGEIQVEGLSFLGYLGDPQRSIKATPLSTGDLGHLDDDGFLYITGRKKHLLITAFGRNVAPEWIESELLAQPQIAQAFVYGEGAATLSAVLLARENCTEVELQAAVALCNQNLPDYARIGAFQRANEAFSTANDLLTSNGKLRREALLQRYDRVSAVDHAPNISHSLEEICP
jgi:long-subunit acyl-CoA synthetase (AMP-forming)